MSFSVWGRGLLPTPIWPGGAVNHSEHWPLTLFAISHEEGGGQGCVCTAPAGPIRASCLSAHTDPAESWEVSELEVRASLSFGVRATWMWSRIVGHHLLSCVEEARLQRGKRPTPESRWGKLISQMSPEGRAMLPYGPWGRALLLCLWFCRLPQSPVHGRHTAFSFTVKLVWVGFLSPASDKALTNQN